MQGVFSWSVICSKLSPWNVIAVILSSWTVICMLPWSVISYTFVYFPRYLWKRPHFRRENDENVKKFFGIIKWSLTTYRKWRNSYSANEYFRYKCWCTLYTEETLWMGVRATHNYVESGTTEKYGTCDSRTSLAICGEIIFVFRHKMMSLANIIQAYLVTYFNTLFTLSQAYSMAWVASWIISEFS